MTTKLVFIWSNMSQKYFKLLKRCSTKALYKLLDKLYHKWYQKKEKKPKIESLFFFDDAKLSKTSHKLCPHTFVMQLKSSLK